MGAKHTHCEPACHEKNGAEGRVKNSVKDSGSDTSHVRETPVPGNASIGHFLRTRDLLTPTGRATIVRLRMNQPRIVEARSIWILAGIHPPHEQ